MREIRNGIIKSTFLGDAGRGFTFLICIEGESWGQQFGGTSIQIAESIEKILEVLEVKEWEKLVGTPCRIDGDSTEILRIGHFYKNNWFSPRV